MNSQVFEEIKGMIPKIFLPKKGEVTKGTELETDLGITGDDADEFIVKFSEKFNVDIKEFNFNSYFLSEGEDTFHPLFSWLFRKKIKKSGRKRIALGDLEKAVETGKLI